jgi:outer membrane translocation and assembly module TamA
VFTDAGNAFLQAGSLSGAPFYWSAGVGARLRTPVGPIGMDLAYRLRTDPRDRGRFAVHFYIGYAF